MRWGGDHGSIATAGQCGWPACGSSHYDPNSGQSCCNGQIYSTSSQTCCDGTTLVNIGWCYPSLCNNNLFDPNTQECCGGNIVTKGTCCGSSTYDSGTQGCGGGHVIYDLATQEYNPNADIAVPIGQGSWPACNGTVFNPMLICSTSGQIFDPSWQQECPDGSIATTGQCPLDCNGTSYNPGTQGCCSGQVYSLSGQDCCAGTFVATKGECPTCSGEQYDPNLQTCCGGTLYPASTGCCDGAPYDPSILTCCGSGVYVPAGTPCPVYCGGQQYDPSTQGCCSGQTYELSTHGCCDDEIYDLSSGQICCGYTLYDAGSATGQSCCGDALYDPSTQGCCDSVIYDLSSQDCCGNTVTPKGQCCNGQSYDPEFQECCGDRVVPQGHCCREGPLAPAEYDPSIACCTSLGLISQRQTMYSMLVASCPFRVQDDSIPQTSDGCSGPSGGNWDEPPGVGNANFNTACYNHDICYQTCNSDKDACDSKFFSDMSVQCTIANISSPLAIATCEACAVLYYEAVAYGGESAYEEDQVNHCKCCQ